MSAGIDRCFNKNFRNKKSDINKKQNFTVKNINKLVLGVLKRLIITEDRGNEFRVPQSQPTTKTYFYQNIPS